jgi:hypothetical protein
MCTVLLPPGVNPTAVYKIYHISITNIGKYSGKGSVIAEGVCGGNQPMGRLFLASVEII